MTFRPNPARHVSEPLARVVRHILAQQSTEPEQASVARFVDRLRPVRDEKKESAQ